MAQIILPIKVEVARPNFFQAIVAKQYDNASRWLKVTLVHEKEKIEVSPDSVVLINAKRNDGEEKSAYGSVLEDGKLLVPLTSWMLELAGTLECDVSVIDTDEKKLTSTKFIVEVEKASCKGQNIADDENYDILITALADVAKAKEDATAAANEALEAAEDAKHLPTISEDNYWMLWDAKNNCYVKTSYCAKGADAEKCFDSVTVDEYGYLKIQLNGEDIVPPVFVGSDNGADGLFVSAEDGKLYLTENGNPLGEGIEFPESGTGFDSMTFDEGGYLHIQLEGEDVVEPVLIGTGGGGSGYGSTLKVTNRLPSKTLTVMNTAETVEIAYTVTSVDSEDKTPTGDCNAEWYVNGTRVAVQTVEQGDRTFDVKPYLNDGTANTVKLYVEDSYGNNRTVTWTINVTKYGLTWNLDSITNHGGNSLNVRIVATGTGNKTVYLLLDGREILKRNTAIDGGTITQAITPQTHGSHTITAYMEASVNGETLKTDELIHTGIWEQAGNYSPIVALHTDKITVNQFETVGIKYMVSTPGYETSLVQIKKGSEILSEGYVDRSIQTYPYKATTTGSNVLTFTSGGDTKTIEIDVQSIGYDITPITEGLVLDINPEGHTNTESNRNSFGFTDKDGVNHPFVFSDNFDWINGGFQTDEEGVTAFVVKRGCYVTADRSLFDDNAKVDGKQIKMIFKSAMVRDRNTEIISCVSNGIGFSARAEESTLSSELKSMNIPYSTDKKVEMDISIEAESENRFACIYLKANPSRGMEYDSSDTWSQSTPAMLKIGSDEADVWIYRIKMYGYAHTRREILQNYIADCANPAEMISRYERNDVFTSDGSLDMNKLSQKNPELRVFHIKGNKMTTSKEDEVTVDVEMWYASGGEEHHFVAEGVTMKAQGTSSLEYIAAALNLDLDFSSASSWQNGKGESITSYAFSTNAIPVDYFNLKADVASCEKANNVLNVERYNRFNPFVFKGKALNNKVRDTIEGHPCAVFFTNTSSGEIAVGDRTLSSGATMLYFAGNMNNSKKNFAVFGQNNSSFPDQCCVEIMNNNALECRFKKNIGDDEKWKDGNFEFRYPKNPTDAMKERFKEVHAWVVSTDTTAATNASLGRTVDYGEKDLRGNSITYTTDSAAYRKAKFVHEVGNYFHTDSLDFHYLYTEFTCGVDNRAKNCFVSYEPDANDVWKWSFRTHYDHDTAYGNDNSGGLTFTYGLEDIDSVGNAKVFNASDSVLWCNVRDFRTEELHDMYVSRESLGCWDAKNILDEFNAYQTIRPEALEMEDAYNKYRVPKAIRYRSMMLGTKEYQRDSFIPKQEAYMASKHRGSSCTKHKITLRANVPIGSSVKGDVVGVVPFVDIYLRCQFGNVGEAVIRAKAGEEYTLVCPPGANLNDLETYLFSSQYITHIGSLANVHPKFVDFSDAPLLRRAEIGSGELNYSNTSMNTANTGGISFDNNPYLEYIDLRNIPYLSQPLNLSKLTSLEEIYITGSGITGIEFAKGAPIRRAALNNPTKLIARGLNKIEQFTVGAVSLTSLWIEESPAIDTLTLVKTAAKLERGRLPDVVWRDDNADAILRLSNKTGFDEFGKETDKFVLKGSAHLNSVAQAELDDIHSAFAELDVAYSNLVSSVTVTFQNYDGTVFEEATQEVRQGGSAVNPVTAGMIPTPVREPTIETSYIFIGWNVSLDNITEDLVAIAVFAERVRTYTVNWWSDMAETTLLYSVTGLEAYSSAEYAGADPSSVEGKLWMGWDGSSSNIVSDLNIHAVFITPIIPDRVASDYDYLYSDDPADRSGYSLAEFYGIIQGGVAKDFFSVGDKIKIVPDTTAFVDNEIVLQVYGFNHYKLSGGTEFASVVFGMVGLMNAVHKLSESNTNIGGWAATAMRTYLNETVYPALPVQWQTMIKTVDVLSSEGNTSAVIVTAEDKLFLFSEAELGLGTPVVPLVNEVDADAESVAFEVFTDNSSRIKRRYNGTGDILYWWLRSPNPSNNTQFRYANSSGSISTNTGTNPYGVCFGFCI